MQYFKSNDYCFPDNGKVLTHATCYSILEKDSPDLLATISEDEHNPMPYKQFVEQTDKPEKPVLMLVRNPVDRFISACSMNGAIIPVERHIEGIKAGEDWYKAVHFFQKQSDWVTKKTTLYQFPRDLEKFCKKAGFAYPMPRLNEAQNEKVVLTDEQLAWVKDYYADDIKLFEGIK